MAKPITANLKVSYSSKTHEITIKPCPNVEVPHVERNKINWIKKGKGRWRFALLSISPSGQFYVKSFQPNKQIRLVDNDRNETYHPETRTPKQRSTASTERRSLYLDKPDVLPQSCDFPSSAAHDPRAVGRLAGHLHLDWCGDVCPVRRSYRIEVVETN